MKLVESSIKYPVTVIVGVFFIILFGLLAVYRIPIQLTPDVTRPVITVNTTWPGASPQEVERELVDEQEEYLKNVEDLQKLTSQSADSTGQVGLEFSVGTDIDTALLKVSTKLDQVPSYPDDANRPTIVSASENATPSAYIIVDSIDKNSSFPIGSLRNFVEDYVVPRLERVSGVGKVILFGGQEEEMQVIFDEKAVAARNLTIGEISRALSEGNRNISAGDFEEGKRRYIVRTEGEYLKPEDAEKVVIKYVEGAPVEIKDVGDVRYGYKEATGLVVKGGREILVMPVTRQVGANVLEMMEGIREAISELNHSLLADRGLQLELTYDETDYIHSAIGLVRQNIFVGGALAFLVLLIFLRSFSPTFIVALTIPISIVGTFMMLVFLGRTINVISLAGTAFAVGMVMDNSIVVLENIYRHMQMGESRKRAAFNGAKEVWGAILASTLTTLAVFLPVIFVEEEAGQLFRDIAIAISCAVFLSLIVAITVIPCLASRIMKVSETQSSNLKRRRRGFRGLFGLADAGKIFTNSVASFVYWVCGRVSTRLAIAVVLPGLALIMALFLAPKAEYLPEGNKNLVMGFVVPPPGYGLKEYEEMQEFVWEGIKQYRNSDQSGLQGAPSLKTYFFVNYGQMTFIGLLAQDPLRAKELIPILRDRLLQIPGIIPVVTQSSLFQEEIGAAGRTIDVDISGPELPRLVALGQRVFKELMGLLPGAQLRPIPSLDLGNPEVRIIPDRDRASKVGLTAQEIGINVAALLDGIKVGEVRKSGDTVDLTLMGGKDTIRHIEDFENLQINTPTGKLVTLGSVANIRLVAGPTQISHIERQRSITIQVSPPLKMPLETAMDMIRDKVNSLKAYGEIQEPYTVNLAGAADDLTRTRQSLQGNFLLALVITFLLMAALFESFLYPFVIMFSVPLAAAGGFMGLFLVNRFYSYQPMDVLTMLGFVILIGVVVNNAILIVHQALNFIRHEGEAPREAIRHSVITRIRPIFMSTFTSVLAMLPLVLFPGAGSELYRGLGSVIIGGLIISTIFTLVLVPSLFSLTLDVRSALNRSFTKASGEPTSHEAERA